MVKSIPRHLLVGGIILLVFLMLSVWLVIAYAKHNRVATVGDLAPNIQLTTVTGKKFELSSLHGHPVLIN